MQTLSKTCRICQETKDLDEFFKHPHTRDRRQPRCKKCSVSYHTNRNRTVKENWRKYQYLKKYGLTVGEYEQMFSQQNGVCAICHKKSERSLGVDHDHATGKVRGLLCHNCNVGIGLFKESQENLRSAMTYLERSQSEG